MPDTTFTPGTVITNHSRLRRVDPHEGGAPVVTFIEVVRRESSMSVSPQNLPVHACCFNPHHSIILLSSLQHSHVIPEDCQLVPAVMVLETSHVRMLIASDVRLDKTTKAKTQALERVELCEVHPWRPKGDGQSRVGHTGPNIACLTYEQG